MARGIGAQLFNLQDHHPFRQPLQTGTIGESFQFRKIADFSREQNGGQFLTIQAQLPVMVSLKFTDELQALPGIRDIPREQFQDSNHLGNLRLTHDRHLVISRFQTLEVDVRLPRQSLAYKTESFWLGRNGRHLP